MEIKINKWLLDEAIERVAKAVDQNPFIPVMKGILVEAQDSMLTIIASNGEISIKHVIPSSVDMQILSPGIILVELSLLRNIVKKLDGDISLKSEGNLLTVTTEFDRYSLNLYDTSEYPEIDFAVYGETLKIKWDELKSITKNVSFAASNNEANLVLCCVNISAHDGKLKFVATNKYRYAEETKEIDSDANFNVSIQAKNLKDLTAFDFKDSVLLNISEHKIAFEVDSTIIQSKVVNQPYQDVSRIVPREFATCLKIEKRELNNLLSKASVIISETNNKIKLSIVDGILMIASTRDEIANAEIITKNFSYDGDELKLALNSKYLREAIAVFEGTINIHITKDKLRLVVKSDSHPNNIQLFTPQKGF
ncbi:DNA polymerase III beta chain [Metamycoplasma arthritidis]|uniref:DNA polymerase III, beta subunit n=1 Tax=Metamycoplasma arthritidis (strain 158L3-1) TaxID=243272 RepID=B3PLR8_META1|nr:DNA polymerase III subunit beta [Metamycoplasma arthritidis]ACF06970.1 DNA polymerase III, beta subunit [Metamycoplasma arthritidis 158L3-1]VEU78499.1 DNA polymerase III beta chain [Metamycoplasma arthritidis]